MALRELVTVLRYELREGNLKKYVDGYRNAEKAVNAVAQVANAKLKTAVVAANRELGTMNRTGNQAVRVMGRLAHEAREFGIGLRQGARQGYGEVLRQMDRVHARQRRINREARSGRSAAGDAGYGMGNLSGVIHGVLASISGKAIMDASDEWAGTRARIGLQTPDSRTRDRSIEFLYGTSQATGQQFSSLADTYVALARGRDGMGTTNDQTLQLSNTISKLMTIGGGSAASQDAALMQFGQAMNSGVLRGEELNSILEQAPRLAQAIAEALGTSVGKLKDLGQEGKITSKALADGLLRQTRQVDAEFAKLPMTFSRSMTQIRNNFVRRAGEMNQQYRIAERFNAVAQIAIRNMDKIGAVLAVMAGGYVLRFLLKSLAGFASDLGKAFALIGRAGRPVLLFFNRLASGNVAQAFAKLGPLGLRFLRIVRGIGMAISALGTVGGVAFLALIAAVAAAVGLIYKYWQPIKAFLLGVWDGVATAGREAFGELAIALAPLGPAFAAIGGWLQQIWTWFVQLLDPVQSTSAELENAAAYGKLFGQALLAPLRLNIKFLGLVVKAIVWLGEAIGTAIGWIVVTASNAWDTLKGGVSALWDWITGMFRNGWAMVSGMVPDWFKSGFNAVMPGGAGPKGWQNVGAGSVVNAGRSAVNQTITQTASVQVSAPPGGNPASFGAAAQRGTSKALGSLQYQLPTPVEAF